MVIVPVRVLIPFVQENGIPVKAGAKMLLKRTAYLRYRGLDYIGRLCVRAKLGDREYLRFIETARGLLPFDPEEVLVYKGGCCVSDKPEEIKVTPTVPAARETRLASYSEALQRFYAIQATLTEEERRREQESLAVLRARVNTGCRGCRKVQRQLEADIVAVERAARRSAGVEPQSAVESEKPA